MVHDADADALLFPYVVVSDNVTTMISVVNHDTNGTGQLHYAYFYKLDPNDRAQECEEGDFWRESSEEDVVAFDVGGIYGSATGGVLFGDPGAIDPTTANAGYTGPFDVLGALAPTRAFLLVDNGQVNDAELYGEAMLFDYALGAAWGYRAYNSLDTSALNPAFGNAQEVQGEVLNWFEAAPLHLLPLSEFQTLFFVTPVGTNQDAGNKNVVFYLFDVDPASGQNLVAWDRDENPISGYVEVSITCVGAVSADELMTTMAYNHLVDTGGWTYANTWLGSGAGAVADAVVFKLEYNLGSTLNGEPIVDTLNTAVWLRDNANWTGAFGSRVGAGGIDGF
jgi:hypothetical protein